MNLLLPSRLDALARNYALGTLRGRARRRFEQLLARSSDARAAVLHWQETFAGTLGAAVPPLAPREAVWRSLQQRLGLDAATPPAAAALSPWRRLFSARVLGGALAGALAGIVASTALLQTHPGWLGLEATHDALPASYVGVLADAAGRPAVVLSARRHGRLLSVKLLQPLAVPPGQSALLWAFAKDAAVPFAVGRLPAGTGAATITLPDSAERLFFGVERLGINFEPAAAPEPSAPSGPMVVAGPCVKVW